MYFISLKFFIIIKNELLRPYKFYIIFMRHKFVEKSTEAVERIAASAWRGEKRRKIGIEGKKNKNEKKRKKEIGIVKSRGWAERYSSLRVCERLCFRIGRGMKTWSGKWLGGKRNLLRFIKKRSGSITIFKVATVIRLETRRFRFPPENEDLSFITRERLHTASSFRLFVYTLENCSPR